MKIKDILRTKGPQVWTIPSRSSLRNAIALLAEKKIGALLVTDSDEQKIVGILSERDIVRGSHEIRKPLEQVQVAELMTRKVITATPEDEISRIMEIMTDRRIRHIPVIEEGELCGLVSIGDIVKALLGDSEEQIRSLKQYIYGITES